MTTYCQKQSPSYQVVVKQIDALLALPYACRSDFWWQEEYARMQQSRDAILPPKQRLTIEQRKQARRHQRRMEYQVKYRQMLKSV